MQGGSRALQDNMAHAYLGPTHSHCQTTSLKTATHKTSRCSQDTQGTDPPATDDTNIVIMDKPRLNDGSAQEQKCHHHNTHHTDNHVKHDAPAHATGKTYTNYLTDNQQDMHPRHTDKPDASLRAPNFDIINKVYPIHLRRPQALAEPGKC